MKRIFLSNLLKIKNTSINKLIILFPLICALISLLFSSLGGESVLSLTVEISGELFGLMLLLR